MKNLRADRRSFLRGLAACGALGAVRPIFADCTNTSPCLRLGVLSDIHLRAEAGSDSYFKKALRYFRDRGVDGVIIAGDIADSGRVDELQFCADAWFSVFPNDTAPDGRHVERLFVYGNHCIESWRWGGMWTSPYKDEAKRLADAIGYADNRKTAWERAFHEEYKPIWMKTVRGFPVIGAHWTKLSGEGIEIEAFMKNHRDDIDPTRPFFYIQHNHPKDTCFGAWAYGHDDGRSTRALSAFPNAVAFTGHSHYTLTDERSVWQGAFTSCNAGSLFYTGLDYSLRENTAPNKSGYMGEKRKLRMSGFNTSQSHQGQVLSVYPDRLVLERLDFAGMLSLGDDIVLPQPLCQERPYAFDVRAASRVAPEFAASATVSVASAKDEAGETLVTVSFPPAETRQKCRVFEYEVTATLVEDGVDLVQAQRRVMAPDFHLADYPQQRLAGQCVFAASDLLLKGNYVFSVRPVECFGHKGKAIASAPVTIS